MNENGVIRTERQELLPATPTLLRAELAGPDALAAATHAHVPKDWPPDLYDDAAIRWALDWLIWHPEQAAWSFYYFVLPKPAGRTLVGLGGFKGAPTDGAVEIGYSVVGSFQRRGFASEAVRGFVRFAFADRRVERVIAETLPHLVPSIGVLEKCGFAHVGDGSEPGVIRFALPRDGPPPPA